MAALLALVAACAFALGNAMQQRGALRTSAPGESPRFLLQLFRHPVWVVGGALQIAGFVAQVVALAVGSLLAVQAIVVSSFVIALPCGVWLTDQRVGRREVLGALTTVAGLILFLVGSRSTGGTNHVAAVGWVACLAVSGVVLAGLDISARRVGAAPAAALLGTAAGIAFGLQGGQVKALAHVGGGVVGVVTSWQLYALAVVGIAGFVYQQRGLKVGVLAPNLAASNVATLVASVVLGVALFAETLGRGAIGLALSVPGLVLMAAGILALARGGVAPSVVPGVATAIEGAIEAAEAKVTQGKATGATFGPEATEAETSDVEVAQPGAATPDRQSTSSSRWRSWPRRRHPMNDASHPAVGPNHPGSDTPE
jgi:drug/metabolite transporter (DMT)-like permease